MLSYDEKYDGYQVAKKAGAEDADSRRTDQGGQITQKSQYCPSCRTCYLFTSYGFTYRERCTDSGNRYLSQGALCASTR